MRHVRECFMKVIIITETCGTYTIISTLGIVSELKTILKLWGFLSSYFTGKYTCKQNKTWVVTDNVKHW